MFYIFNIMSGISNTETAILGLLYEHHHYAYRIEEIIEKRAMRNWADLEYSSIDHVLKGLEEKNLVKREMREDNEEVYSITDEGRKIFLEKISELISEKGNVIYPFDLGLANMNFLSHDEITSRLKLYLKSLEERIGFLDSSIRIQEENNVPYNFIAIFSRSSALLKAEKDWVKEFIKKIEDNGI